MYIYIYIYMCTYIHMYIYTHSSNDHNNDNNKHYNNTGKDNIGRPILYTTTTQRGWCIEAFVSILVQSQSQESLLGGGGV